MSVHGGNGWLWRYEIKRSQIALATVGQRQTYLAVFSKNANVANVMISVCVVCAAVEVRVLQQQLQDKEAANLLLEQELSELTGIFTENAYSPDKRPSTQSRLGHGGGNDDAHSAGGSPRPAIG